MKKTLMKKYALLTVLALVFFSIFLFLEKQNYNFNLDHNNDLSMQSKQLIKTFVNGDSIKIEVYSNKNSAVSKKISQFIKQFYQVNKQLKLEFIDPVTNPSLVTLNAISMQGEMVLKYQDENKVKKINITELSETALVNALLKLGIKEDKWLVIAEGFGMRSINDESTKGLTTMLVYLKKIGYHIARMPLNTAVQLPENVKVIVLPAPTIQLDEASVNWLKKQSDQGISIWWMQDVLSEKQLYLELAYDTVTGKKTMLDNTKYSTVLSEFSNHKITENFNQPVYFAEANEIVANNAQAIVKTNQGVPIAVSKQLPNSRLIVTGDADFISNQYINVAANRNFTTRILDWLFYYDNRVNVPVVINNHTQLLLSQKQLIFLSITFLIVIPLVLLVTALIKYRDKHA